MKKKEQDDLEYFRSRLYTALGVPKHLLEDSSVIGAVKRLPARYVYFNLPPQTPAQRYDRAMKVVRG